MAGTTADVPSTAMGRQLMSHGQNGGPSNLGVKDVFRDSPRIRIDPTAQPGREVDLCVLRKVPCNPNCFVIRCHAGDGENSFPAVSRQPGEESVRCRNVCGIVRLGSLQTFLQ